MFYSPIKLAVAGIVAWFVVWLITPVDVIGYLPSGAVIYAFVSYAALMIGSLLARDRVREAGFTDQAWNQPLERRLFTITCMVGLLGIALRVIDRLYFRGIQYGMDVFELRESLSASSSTPAGIIGGALFPFCLIPLMLLIASRDRKSKLLLLLASVVFVLPMVENLFQLSRSFMFQTVGLGFATIVIARYHGKPLNGRLIMVAVGGVATVLMLSTFIFTARLESSQRRIEDSVFDSVYATFLRPNNAATQAISSESAGAAFVTLAVLPNGMYYISGAYEFGALWERPGGQPFAYGQIHLFPFFLVVNRLAGLEGSDPDQIVNYVYRDGVFQTFFGPLWIDFGWFGPALMLVFGYMATLMAYRVQEGAISVLPIYVYLTIVILFMPVVNFIVNGLGMFAMTAFIIFAILAGRAGLGASPRGPVRME